MWRTCVLPAFVDWTAAADGGRLSTAIVATDGRSVLIETSGAMCGQVDDDKCSIDSLAAAAIGDPHGDAVARDGDVERCTVGRPRLDVDRIPAVHVAVRPRQRLRQRLHLVRE